MSIKQGWIGSRFGPKRRRSEPIDEAAVRTIGWRLALLSLATIASLLVILGLAVYVIARSELMEPLKTAVTQRAQGERAQLLQAGLPGEQAGNGPGGPPGGGGQGPPHTGIGLEPVNSGVFLSVLNSNLRVSYSTRGGPCGSSGRKIPDPGAAAMAVASSTPRMTTFSTSGEKYLLYSDPVYQSGQLLAVIQASTPEVQYQDDLNAILTVLLLVGGAGIVLAFLITAVLVQRALLPIRASMSRQRDFVADAAHELRTPLAILRSAGESLLRARDDEKREEMAQITLEETGHLTRLVNDLSLLARSDTGTLDFQFEPVDISILLDGVVTEADVLAEDHGVTVDRTIESGVTVSGDGMRLRQVLLILLDNAIKHTQENATVRVTLEVTRRRATIRVIDSGPGIAEADLPHIFDRFYRADTARTGEGTGLGLSIAMSIIQAHGGTIVAGNVEDGAAFTISLPTT